MRRRLLEVDVTVEPLPDVVGRQSRPHDICKIRRDVIQGSRPQERFVRGRQHRQARAEARAENANRLVALRRQPGDAAARVEHCLPADLRRPADVRADDVVRAAKLRRHARVVIRHAEAQRADLEAVEETAETDVAVRVGVPLRQNDHGALAAGRRVVRKIPRPHGVVLGVRRLRRRSDRRATRRRDRSRSMAASAKNCFALRDHAVGPFRMDRSGDAAPPFVSTQRQSSGSSTHSRPHSNGRTIRSVETDARRRSHA